MSEFEATQAGERNAQLTAAWLWMAGLLIAAGAAIRQPTLFAVAACLLTVIPVAWLWRRWSLKGVEYVRSFDKPRAFPGEVVTLSIGITNRKLLPVTWLETLDEIPNALPLVKGQLAATHDPNVGILRNTLALRWYERFRRKYELLCTGRGSYALGPVHLRAGDVFALFEERKTVGSRDRLVVYPRIWPLEALGLPAKEPFGTLRARWRLLEDPLRTVGVRGYLPEDTMRRVHWKATAHRGELQVRVYEPASTPTLVVALNVTTFEHHWEGVLPELFENAVSVAGSVATWSIGMAFKTGLVANGCPPRSDQPIRVPPGRSSGQLAAILESLAGVTSFATSSIGSLLRRESPRIIWSATLVVVTAIVTEDLCAEMMRLRMAGRPIALVSVAEEAPPHLEGVTTYHLPPDSAPFGCSGQGASDAEDALRSAGLLSRWGRGPSHGLRATGGVGNGGRPPHVGLSL